jgi:2-dehydropantoate 2-reductase
MFEELEDGMRLLVVGAGATGGYFGGRLALAGRDVTFLVRSNRAAKLQETGLRIHSPHGDFSLSPKLVTAGHIDGPFDIVLLTVKAYTLAAAIDDMAPAIGPQTMILPVLNGMKHIDVLKAHFGRQTVLGGVCKIASTVDEAGLIRQLAPFHEIDYGELDGSASVRIKELDAFMQGAGFDARLSMNIEREMWEKWILLSSLGGITCLMRGNIGEIEAAPGGVDFAFQFLDEVTSVVRTVGIEPHEKWMTMIKDFLTTKGSSQTSSMYRDLHAGSRIEADQIIGDLLARAKGANLSTPLLAAAYANLSIYQNRVQPG